MPTGTFFAVAPFKVMTVWLKIDGGPAKESCMTVCGLEYEDPRILVPDDSLMNIIKLRIKEEEEKKKKKRRRRDRINIVIPPRNKTTRSRKHCSRSSVDTLT